jgi:diacylglycerol kinase family enzyme
MDIPLGVIPAGTLNHFARDVGGWRDVAQALRVLAGGYTLPVDVARVNERIFLNNSSIGLYARGRDPGHRASADCQSRSRLRCPTAPSPPAR